MDLSRILLGVKCPLLWFHIGRESQFYYFDYFLIGFTFTRVLVTGKGVSKDGGLTVVRSLIDSHKLRRRRRWITLTGSQLSPLWMCYYPSSIVSTLKTSTGDLQGKVCVTKTSIGRSPICSIKEPRPETDNV